MIVLRLALASLANRWLTGFLTLISIALSVMLLLAVEKVRLGARESFADTISGTDLIVGARSGSLNLLLYSVFRIGNATNNISWKTYQDIAARPEVAWIVPISLGDSHRGFRVMGTLRTTSRTIDTGGDNRLLSLTAAPSPIFSTRCWARMWRAALGIAWKIELSLPMAWATSRSLNTTTSRSAWPGS